MSGGMHFCLISHLWGITHTRESVVPLTPFPILGGEYKIHDIIMERQLQSILQT